MLAQKLWKQMTKCNQIIVPANLPLSHVFETALIRATQNIIADPISTTKQKP